MDTLMRAFWTRAEVLTARVAELEAKPMRTIGACIGLHPHYSIY